MPHGGEDATRTRLIFASTAHAKYEMTLLDERHRMQSVFYATPLSRNVFSKLMDTDPHFKERCIREKVIEITNCVPQEFVYLSNMTKEHPGPPISVDNLQTWMENRARHFFWITDAYRSQVTQKQRFYEALVHMFLGNSIRADFECDFWDLGLVYRSKCPRRTGAQYHTLCFPVQVGVLALFRALPLPDNIQQWMVDGKLAGTNLRRHSVFASSSAPPTQLFSMEQISLARIRLPFHWTIPIVTPSTPVRFLLDLATRLC
ncbi:hypothetical protein B0O80DRAFT_40498 [Mortierella sp. GBAus27b]|nr:hypothetical protein B0O80DRAFT_40498 [Mortierella sp. GBAus27b]